MNNKLENGIKDLRGFLNKVMAKYFTEGATPMPMSLEEIKSHCEELQGVMKKALDNKENDALVACKQILENTIWKYEKLPNLQNIKDDEWIENGVYILVKYAQQCLDLMFLAVTVSNLHDSANAYAESLRKGTVYSVKPSDVALQQYVARHDEKFVYKSPSRNQQNDASPEIVSLKSIKYDPSFIGQFNVMTCFTVFGKETTSAGYKITAIDSISGDFVDFWVFNKNTFVNPDSIAVGKKYYGKFNVERNKPQFQFNTLWLRQIKEVSE